MKTNKSCRDLKTMLEKKEMIVNVCSMNKQPLMKKS